MALVKWRPSLDLDFDHFFDDLSFPINSQKTFNLIPAIDVYEKKNKVVVEMPLVGIDPKKVDISIENNILTVKGKTEKKSEVEEKNYYRKEIRSGNFYRSISLPKAVSDSKAIANYQDGVLKIEIPKISVKKSRIKKIPIKINEKK
ncbi:MAG: Hsp20/alpha crystallin family protein [Candidatus Aenigmarchaeota archaeon]|nr:Hsp20/alpha crystallin family protein [Candidatus Aenigmarchaeota archaeon]